MINHLAAAEADHSLLKKLHLFQAPEVLVIDEVGYLPLGSQGSNLFFQVISARHEKNPQLLQRTYPLPIGEKSSTALQWPRQSPIALSITQKLLSLKDPAIEQDQKQNK